MDVERGGTSGASAGAIKTERDPDEHAQANTHNGGKKKNNPSEPFFFFFPFDGMSHKSKLSFESFILFSFFFTGANRFCSYFSPTTGTFPCFYYIKDCQGDLCLMQLLVRGSDFLNQICLAEALI